MGRRRATQALACVIAVGVILLVGQGWEVMADDPGARTNTVDPGTVTSLFQQHCVACHGERETKAGLDLRSIKTALKGSDAGPVIVPGKLDESLLIEQVTTHAMPPPKSKSAPLSDPQIELLKRWIQAGAKDVDKASQTAAETRSKAPGFWAFQPPKRPDAPRASAREAERVSNPIDSFILAQLEPRGLSLSPPADRRALARRLSFDLRGLPPTAEELDAFVADSAPDAYERLVDRWLASPAHGERWGRHWLDLAGYADSEGILDADHARAVAWRYRDWVVHALNADQPYDQFLIDQIAGDERSGYHQAFKTEKHLPPEVVDAITATGFLRCASDTSRPDFVNIKNAPGYYYQTLEDTVKILASGVMGLTLQCAKCHTHKYDPIPQREYYQFQAIFMSGYRPDQWVAQVERRLREASAAEEAEVKAWNDGVTARVAERSKQVDQLKVSFGERLLKERLAKLPAAIRDDVKAAVDQPADKRDVVQKYLASKFETELKPPAAELAKVLGAAFPEFAQQTAAHQAAIKAEQVKTKTLPEIRAFYDLAGEPKTPVLRQGDWTRPGPLVQPGVLSMLATPQPFTWTPPPKDAPTSGRRLAFARWLTQPGHPLTPRVVVNRLWHHHFGVGLVSPPDNLGLKGERPSHPELLDWLATEIQRQGWSLKAIHRLIVCSSTYRQAAGDQPETPAMRRGLELDPDNRLLWRQRTRRLDAESLRDAMLAVSGRLNPQRGGPPVPIRRQADGEVLVDDNPSGWRRSIYLEVKRSQPLTLLQVFDQPVMETNCTERGTSTVASQALVLLNSSVVEALGAAMAERLETQSQDKPKAEADAGRVDELINRGWVLAWGRAPSDAERSRGRAFLQEQARHHGETGSKGGVQARRRALADLCQMLLSANEFAYVD